jgi:hypothetical protein
LDRCSWYNGVYRASNVNRCKVQSQSTWYGQFYRSECCPVLYLYKTRKLNILAVQSYLWIKPRSWTYWIAQVNSAVYILKIVCIKKIRFWPASKAIRWICLCWSAKSLQWLTLKAELTSCIRSPPGINSKIIIKICDKMVERTEYKIEIMRVLERVVKSETYGEIKMRNRQDDQKKFG